MLTRALEILERLVAFDTTSSRSNRALIDWVAAHLAGCGIPAWQVPSEDGTKTNLLACLGPNVAGGVMLSGHSDVVPVTGQAWQSDPWTLSKRNERLYGRGTADMKGFLALALALVETPEMARLTRPLLLALTYDEEVGCLGAPRLIDRIGEFVGAPALAIIGEPTSMKVVSVHKGMRVFEVVLQGLEAHSSQRDRGVSAIAAAVELMGLIGELNAEAGARANPDDPCDPPGTTLSIGIVEGGTAANILAARCRFVWDLRALDEAEADAIETRFRQAATALDARIKARAATAGVIVSRTASAPPLALDQGGAAESFVRALTGDNGLAGAAFVAEAGLYQRAGIPAVLCGPGSILQAHQPDEWIALDQLEQGAAFMSRLVQRLSA